MREASCSQPLDRHRDVLIIFAGHETTTNAAAGSFRALLEHHERWEALCADSDLIANAVEKSLRFYLSITVMASYHQTAGYGRQG